MIRCQLVLSNRVSRFNKASLSVSEEVPCPPPQEEATESLRASSGYLISGFCKQDLSLYLSVSVEYIFLMETALQKFVHIRSISKEKIAKYIVISLRFLFISYNLWFAGHGSRAV
jgi:hypothetical protein